MSELIHIIVAVLVAGVTFVLVFRRTRGDCTP